MVFTRQKSRAGENPESPARTQPGKKNCLNPRPHMTRWKHCLFNHLVQEERKYQPNQ